MVVKEDGTKWACQSCLKGHRVSGCTHTDRPLIFVPKKGRPVTQCQHCRVERKKRSAHVKCDCGEKTHHTKDKCPHLRHEGSGHEGHELDPVPEDCQLEDASCCCHHGENCTCASMKKDSGSDSEHHHVPHRSKPRLTTTHSDGHIPNGHHKSIHRHNHAAHDALPYKLPRSHTDHPVARRSVDSVTSDKGKASATIPSQPAFNFATPPEEPSVPSSRNMSTDNLVDGFPFMMNQVQAQGSTSSMDFFDFAQAGNTTNGTNGFDMSMAQNDSSMNAFAMPSASSGAPLSATATTEPAFDWNNFDWAAMTTMDDTQPALTYASSNTHSEFGEHTPPEEFGSLYGNQNFMRSMQEVVSPVDQSMQTVTAPALDVSMNQSAGQSNRWSLPHSFWTGIGDGTPSANASSESIASNPNGWTAPYPTTGSNGFVAQSNTLARSNTSASVGPPRPRAAAQNRNATLPGDPGWERLLQQYQAGELWGDDGFASAVSQSQQMTDAVSPTAGKTPISAPTDNLYEQNLDIGMLQPTDNNQQFFMDADSIGPFDFNGDFPTPGYTNGAWPQ